MASMLRVRRHWFATSALALVATASPSQAAGPCTWLGGTGDWTSATMWSCGVVPDSTTPVFIDGGKSGFSTVNLVNTTQSMGALTLDGGDTLALNNSYLYGYGDVVANGTIVLANASRFIAQGGPITFSGTESIVLDASVNYAQLMGAGSNQLTFAAGFSVLGAGQIGLDQGAITNNGLVNANVAGGVLQIDSRGGSGVLNDGSGAGPTGSAGLYNTGLLEATNGATLQFLSGTYQNSATGVIQAAGAGSRVLLDADAHIIGGTLASSGGGVIAATNVTQYLTDVTLAGGSNLALTNDSLGIGNTLTNNGTVTIANSSRLYGNSVAGNAVAGTGTIVLDNSVSYAQLYGASGNKLTIGAGQMVIGAGQIGLDQGGVTFNGVVNANVAGRTIELDARGGSGSLTDGSGVGTGNAFGMLNNNLLQATNGGTLLFDSGTYQNAGLIQAVGAGSVVQLGGDSSITGGTLASSGGGVIAGTNVIQYLTDVTLAGGSNLALNNDYLGIGNTLTNNGTITVANSSRLYGNSAGGNAIAGTGTIVLDNSASYAQLFGGSSNRLTIGSGQMVIGAGQVGVDAAGIVNNGVVNANVTGRTIELDARGGSGGLTDASGVGANNFYGLLNANLLEATNGGTLLFDSGTYQNAGLIQAVGSGSVVQLGGDSSITGGTLASSGGGVIAGTNVIQYLTDVTLAGGSNLSLNNDYLGIGNTLTNNGTITVANSSRLYGNSAGGNTIAGTGTIVLDNSASYAQLFGGSSNRLTIGAGQVVRGSGEVGLDQGAITNFGNILSDGAITIDGRGGGGGLGDGTGAGAAGNLGFLNAAGGQVQANNGGKTLTLVSGLYQNATGGAFSVGTGSTFTMAGDAVLANLQAGGILNQGSYFAFAGGTMSLNSNQTGAITTIGTAAAGTDTIVTLSGAGSLLQTSLNNGTQTSLDQSLGAIAASGELVLADGRSFTAATGAFANAGELRLDTGARFAATALSNTGLVFGNGTVATPITNLGSVVADGGTLAVQAIAGPTGTVASNAGGTLDLSGASANATAGTLANNGALALGARSITVTSDYTNANFGSGNAFNARANVTGSGLILAASATQDLTGPGLDLAAGTLNVGNVRLGGSSSTTLTITNNGLLTTLRGAVESPVTNTVSISSSNFVVGPNGGNTTVTLAYTGTQAGSLAGNTITVANNFDNVADQTLRIVGAAYNPAAASLMPGTVDLGATRVGGTLSGTITIANTAPVGSFSEMLAVTGAAGSGGASGTAPAGLIGAGASAASAVSIGTAASGSYTGSVTYALATDGTGTSGLARAALPSQSVGVTGRVYQAASAQLAGTSVDLGTVRQGAAAPSASLAITNGANGALNDSLVTSVGTTPAGVTVAGPGALAGGASGAVTFTAGTAKAGIISGSTTLGFQSVDGELNPLTLGSQMVSVSGTVTELAIAQLFKNLGFGTFTMTGGSYTLDLGSFGAGAGSVSTDIGVANANSGQGYSETLGGAFANGGGTGFSFASSSFAGVAGGSSNIGNLLSFNYTGLGAGTYSDTLTFSGFSRYTGLADQALAPITINVLATVTGGGGGGGNPIPAVPEPGSWAIMLAGLGLAGAGLRRRRRATSAVLRLA